MRWKPHVRFGGRAEETDRLKGQHRASVRSDHTHCAHLIAAGQDAKVICTRLGHASVSFTYDRYGHLMPEAGSTAAAAVAALIDGSRI